MRNRVLLAVIAVALSVGGVVSAGEPPSPPPVVAHHVVESGDTFTSIAAEYGVSVQSLALANPVQWARQRHTIYPGDVLHVVISQTASTTSTSTTSSTLPAASTTSTTTPGTTSSSTTSSVPPSTSTSSTSSSTTTSTSTTTPPTTQPPGQGFLATFDDPADISLFDFQLHTSSNGPPCSENPDPGAGCVPLAPAWLGEHDMACGSVATLRDISGGQVTGDDVVTEGLVYHCPNTTGHMMTAVDTGAVAILSFSPDRAFSNITEVCWDQNVNNLGTGKWVNVHIVPEATFQANGGAMHYVAGADSFGLDPTEIPTPPGALTLTHLRGSYQAWQGNGAGGTQIMWQGGPADMDPSPAPRYRHCVTDIAGPNLRFTIARPTGITETFDRPGTMPQGDVRVIWQDGSYNPSKHDGTGHLTWHWDTISVR